MTATDRLLRDLLLNGLYRNQPDPNRTITTEVIGRERISTVTRPDGSTFRVIAEVSTPRRAGSAARIEYPETTS